MKPAEFVDRLEAMNKYSFMDLLTKHGIKGFPKDNNRCPLSRLASKFTGMKIATDNDYLFAADGAEEFGHLPLPKWVKFWMVDFDTGAYPQYSEEKPGPVLSPGQWKDLKDKEKKVKERNR